MIDRVEKLLSDFKEFEALEEQESLLLLTRYGAEARAEGAARRKHWEKLRQRAVDFWTDFFRPFYTFQDQATAATAIMGAIQRRNTACCWPRLSSLMRPGQCRQ
uniref:Uncharacterized protein n=1 Tax=Chromera velia CCMP2878 TaxID=1169474 RepID=A0A0G4HFK2_9ALVE|eukprot:Cvel_6668.t1-p1 / transcript=Cvel_6668.t1 / gene=Cvel_6668 / organism=Chromera_velia_CCMP2878 / gene_product=hypothetical protein / transcript_product=hypothetical protein / location=Cvel_scaffold331:43651-43959(-) / protein_length=103 / sequence_SO=supercontig / SO=protein_coding / is_pseudo=false